MKDKRAIVLEYKAHIRALKRGEPFERVLTGPKGTKNSAKETKSEANKKRKSTGGGSPKAKRRKSRLASLKTKFSSLFMDPLPDF